MSGDVSRAFIVHDWCGWDERQGRFTHSPSGDTLLCPPDASQRSWDRAQLAWFRKYPGLTVHRCPTGPYRETGDTMGTTEEICARLEGRLRTP